MIFAALGLNPSGLLGWTASRAVRGFIWYRGRLCPRIALWRSRMRAQWPPSLLPDSQTTSR